MTRLHSVLKTAILASGLTTAMTPAQPREKVYDVSVHEAFKALWASTRAIAESARVDIALVDFKTGATLGDGRYVWLFWTARCRDDGNGKARISIQVKAGSNAPSGAVQEQKEKDLAAFWARVDSAMRISVRTGERRPALQQAYIPR